MFAICALSRRFDVRRLYDCEADTQAVFELYQSNPQYFDAMKDCPTIEGAKADLTALPPNKTNEDKYYLGFYADTALVAVMDLILGFPNDKTAFIGLFMVNAKYQNKGIGSLIITEVLEALSDSGFAYCRLGYVKNNLQSRSFWEKNGFMPTGVTSEQEHYTIVMMQKDI